MQKLVKTNIFRKMFIKQLKERMINLKKRFIIPAAVAATASAVTSMPLHVLALTDSIDGVEINQGVQLTMRDEQNQLLGNVGIEIYNVDSVSPSADGTYDLTSLTPVKTCTTQEDAEIALGLIAGKYVAKITPPDNYVISDYCSNVRNGANEVIFTVPELDEDESFAFKNILLYFMNSNVESTDALILTVYDTNLNPVSGAVFNVKREALDGSLYDLGDYTSGADGKIVCPADQTDELPAGSRYIFTAKSCPANYMPEEDDTIYLQAIEGYNARNFYLKEKSSDVASVGAVSISIENANVINLPFSIYNSELNVVATGTLSSNKNEMVENLPYGKYKLVIENVPTQYASDNGNYEMNFDLDGELLPIPILFDLSVPIVGDCHIELEVTDADTHTKIKNQTVKILNSKNMVVQTVAMDKDGIAIFDGLPAGTYHFELSDDSQYYVLENQSVAVGGNNKVAWHEVQAKKITHSLVVSTECDDAKVVENLKISLYKDGEKVGTYSMTNGTVTVPDLNVGDYEISVENPPNGYKLVSDTTVSITSENRVVNKTLAFEAQFATIVANVVNTDNNEPLRNVQVNAIDSLGNTVKSAKTDDDGKVSFVLPLGEYTLSAQTPNSYLEMATQKVELNAADKTLNVTFETKFLSANLNIVVADDAGLAVTDAVVEVINSEGEIVHTQSIESDNYIVALADLPLGKYTVRVASCDENRYIKPGDMIVELTEQKTYHTYLTIDTVQQDATTGEVNIVLKDEDGNPVEISGDILIGIVDADGVMILGDYVDANGQISFAELEAGEYTATIFSADAPWVVSEKSDVKFNIVAGETTNAEMTLFDAVGSALINVTDAVTEDAIAGVTLDIYTDGTLIGTYTTNEYGQIEIPDLYIGTYSYVVTDVPTGYDNASESNFEITVDEKTTIDIVLVAKTGQATLNIIDENGELLYKPVVISLTDENDNVYEYTVSDGAISTGWIKAGTYTVSVKHPIDGYSLKSADAVVIVADETNAYNVVFEKDTGSAAIQVKTQNLNENINLPNISVEILNEYNESIGIYTTNASGNLNLSKLPLGKYSINVVEGSLPEGYVPLAGTTFEITKDCNEDVVVYVLRETGDVQIQILKEDDSAAQDVSVALTDDNGNIIATVNTDGNGYAMFSNVPTGDYIVNVVGDDYSLTGNTNINVQTDETITKIYHLNRLSGSLKVDCNVSEPNIVFDICDGDKVIASGVTDDNGEAIVDKLPTGEYIVKFISIPSKYKDVKDAVIAIKKDTETVLDVELNIKGAALDVKYVFEDSNYPVENVEFEIVTLNGETVGVYSTTAAGNSKISLPEGYYVVKTLSLPAGYTLPDDQVVEIVDGVNKNLTFKLMQSTSVGTFALIVQDGNTNSALENVAVKLYRQNGSLYKTFTSDARGQVYDEEIIAGSYSAIISKTGYADVTLESVVIEDGEMFFETVNMEAIKEDVGTLTVTIYDEETGDVLPEASVCLRDAADNIIATGTSDENGVVVFENLIYGNYRLFAEADEYVSSGRIATSISAETQTASIRLAKSTVGTLAINVLDESKKPISGAIVSVRNNGNEFTAITNSSGVAEFVDLEAGQYDIAVSADGYKDVTASASVVANKFATQEIVLSEIKVGNIKVTVVDENDVALSGVQVKLSNGSIYTTDDEGVISISNQDVGEYIAEFTKDGYISKTVSFKVAQNTTTNIEVRLEKVITTGAVEFSVKDSDGTALSEVVISINDKEFKTDKNGYVKVSDLEEGTYIVNISKTGYYSKSAEISIVAKTIVSANVTLKKEVTTGTISATVVDENGNAIEGAEVIVSNDTETYILSSDANGLAIFEVVKPGDYTLVVSKDGYLNSSATVSVEAGKSYTINATLKEKSTKGNLEVVVKDIDGNLLKDASLTINNQQYVTNENGVVTVENLEAGKYEVTISKDGYDTVTASVEVIASKTKQLNATLIKTITTGDLVVNVADTNGNPLTGAIVEINGTSIESDEQGQVRLNLLPAGTYTFTVTKNGYVGETYTVTVHSKQEVVVSVKLEEIATAGDVVVNVFDEDGNAIRNAEVSFGGQIVMTDENGTVTLEDVAAGKYEVTISKDGFNSKQTTVEIEAGKVTTINAKLVKIVQQGSATVKVVDKNGNPVENAEVTIKTENEVVVGEFVTDENGFVDVGALNVGKYYVSVGYELDNGHGVGALDQFFVSANKNTSVLVELTYLEMPEATGSASIKVEAVGGNVLIGAKVQLQNDTVVFGHTAENGIIVFEDLAPGVYDISVSANRHMNYVGTIEVVAGNVTETIVTLHPVTTGNVDISVLDEDGTALSNATVTINGNSYNTDASGHVIIENLENGSYNIVVSANGFKLLQTSVTVVACETSLHEVTLEKEIYTGSAVFTVSDKNNLPIENVTISINGCELQTDAYGRVLFTELEAGRYNAIVSKNGYHTETVTLDVVPEKETMVDVTLKSTTGNLHVTVKDEHGNLLRDANVAINGKTYTTDENGRAFVSGLMPENYNVSVSLDGYVASERTVTIKSDEVTSIVVSMKEIITTGSLNVVVKDETGNILSNAKVQLGTQIVTTAENGVANFTDIEAGKHEITVSKDGYVEKATITTIVAEQTVTEVVALEKIVTTGTLTVIVKDEHGELLTNATVIIDGEQHKTDEHGVVTLVDVQAGSHEVSVSADGYLTQTTNAVITPKEKTTVNVVLSAAPTHGFIKLNVVDQNGHTIPSAIVKIDDEVHVTNNEGQVSIKLPFGTYNAEIISSDYVSQTIAVNVVDENEIEVTVVLERACGNAIITVQTLSDQLLAGATVQITDDNNNVLELITDENGKVELPMLDAGNYFYNISLDGYHTETGMFDVAHGAMTVVNVRLQAKVTHSIAKFEVVDQDGNALNNVLVNVAGASGITDENGFVLLNIPLYDEDGNPVESTYEYMAGKDGYVTVSGKFERADTAITTVKVTMEEIVETGNVQIIVQDSAENAISNAHVVASNGDKSYALQSDEFGCVEMSGLPHGEYTLTVVKDGYISHKSLFMIDEDEEQVKVVLEKVVPPVVYGNAIITVVDNNGDVVTNAEVNIYGEDGNYYNTFYTDANGLVSATLAVGDYSVSVVKNGYVGDDAILYISENTDVKTTLVLEKIVVQETAMAEIHIKNQYGKDVLNASVLVKDKDGNVIYDGKLNNQSSLYLPELSAGEYTVIATKQNHKSDSETFTAVIGTSAIIDLVLVENLETIDAGAIEIVVENKNGAPIEMACVTILNEDGSIYGTYTTPENGVITISAMPIGNYTLYASYNGIDSKNVTTKTVNNQVSTVKLVIDTSSTGGENNDNGGNNNPGGNDNVQTGDTSNIFLYGLMMVLSTIGLIFTRKAQKKNKSK